MGSPLGPVIAGIFMVELERNLLPTLSQYTTSWKKYVDDAIWYVKVDCIENVLNTLNPFHANISVTYEQECDGMISFLYVLVVKKNNTIETTIYRKQTHNDIYLNWESFTPEVWKRGTLKTLLFRVHTNKELLEKEVKHLKHVFITINGFPPWVVSKVISRVKNEVFTTQINQSIVNPELSNVKQLRLILPYKGKKGEYTLRNVKCHITKLLPEQEEVALVFTGTKLGAKFNIKDKTSKEHQDDLAHSVVSPDPNCNEEYNGKTGRRLIERVHKHSDKCVTFHVFKYSIETDHPTVIIDEICVLKTGYCQKNFEA